MEFGVLLKGAGQLLLMGTDGAFFTFIKQYCYCFFQLAISYQLFCGSFSVLISPKMIYFISVAAKPT